MVQILAGSKVGIVLGARQVGKTTLVEQATGQHSSLSLNFDVEIDKLRFLAASKLDPAHVHASFGSPDILVLDEVQRLPEAARIVKGWHDSAVPMRFVLLGSSSLELLSHTTESLTGRNAKLRLPPLVFEESLQPQRWFTPNLPPSIMLDTFGGPLRSALMERMAYGSYPEVVTAMEKEVLLRDLASDYLWKDILQTGLVRTPDLIKRLLMLLAHQIGSEVSTNELATQLNIARATVDRYIELLEQCFVIFQLPAFSTNPRKEISKSKKIYFWDTGIRNALLNEFSTSELRSDIGKLWENWVVSEVAKHNLLRGEPWVLHFWRSRAASEVDLVMQRGHQLKAFEIKWQRRHASNRSFANAYGITPKLLCAENPFTGPCVDIPSDDKTNGAD